MLVLRRLVALSALLVPTLAPAWVGSSGDVVRESRSELTAIVTRSAIASDPVDEPVALWSPGHGAFTSFRPSTSPRELLLSFDDGPDLMGTPTILAELDKRGLKGIFFVTGWRLTGQRPEDVARRDLVRKIAAHGHLVANHGMNHHDLCQNPAEQAGEIDASTELIAETTGVRPLLFRSPYGAFCRSLDAALTARGLPDIGWNIDPQDWKAGNSEDAVFAYLTGRVSELKGRGIMLLHDTHEASVHALPRFLDWLARENERSVRHHRAPVNIIDYRVLVPKRPVTASGIPELVGALVADARGSVERHLP
jgi:peptidoglycan/xylan/chitin deacetylase (PgdA/CDA1 family)